MGSLPPTAQRLLTIFALAAAFIVMASVFIPERARSVEGANPRLRRPASIGRPFDEASTDPHEGLARLGELQDSHYTVKIFATESGALYSVYDEGGTELAVLLTAAQVERRFPELHISTTDFSVPTVGGENSHGGEWPRHFMHVPPDTGDER